MANEKRLIDANLLVPIIEGEIIDTRADIINRALMAVLDLVRCFPTVDAVEVVHGEWGEIYTCHGERLWGYRCSQCEADNSEKSNYCPNCGAKMDGDGNG